MVALLFLTTAQAQTKWNLGVKAGANFSKMSFNVGDYTSDAITKMHVGAFMRANWGRIFLQPEVYFSGKGGDIKEAVVSAKTSFDFSSVDVPLLVGLKPFGGENFNLHIIGGPVLSKVTLKNITTIKDYDKKFFEKYYFAVQYGLGVDFMAFTLDARIEDSLNKVYSQSNINGTYKVFMLSLGVKIL